MLAVSELQFINMRSSMLIDFVQHEKRWKRWNKWQEATREISIELWDEYEDPPYFSEIFSFFLEASSHLYNRFLSISRSIGWSVGWSIRDQFAKIDINQ